MELELNKKQRSFLVEFARQKFDTVSDEELGDDWWDSYMGFDINICYDEDVEAYKACAYALKVECDESGICSTVTDTSQFTTLIYLA
jgi:hypothetical protein